MTRKRGAIPWARSCLGVDLCSGPEPVVVRAERAGNSVRTRTATATEAAKAAAMGGATAGCLGGRQAFARWLAAPYANLGKARRVLPTLLDVELPFPLDACVYKFVRHHVAGDGSVALAVGARQRDVTVALDAYGALELDPQAVFHQGLVLWSQAAREIPRTPQTRSQPRAILYLCESDPVLVVGEAEDPAGLHGLRPQDTADHVRQLMRARFALGTPVEWIFAGPGTADTERLAHITSEVTTDWPGTPTTVREPEQFLAKSIACEALVGSALTCNLRSGDLSHPAEGRRHRVQTRRTAAATLAAGLVLCAVNLAWIHVVDRRDTLLDARLRDEATALAGFRIVAKGDHAVNQVRDAVAQEQRRWAPFLKADQPTLSQLLTDSIACAGQNGLEFSLFAATDEEVTVTGDALTWDGPDPLRSLLSARGFSVQLDRRNARDDGRIPFTLRPEGTL